MPILRASLQHSSTRMLPNPFPRHGLAMARERTSARFSQITASAAQPMNSPPPVSRMRKSLIWPYRFDSERGNSRPSAEHSMSKPWIFFASHIRAGRKTGCMIQRSCPKNDSTKKSGLHPGTSCGAWPLPRASPVAVPIFKAVVPLHTGAMPAETPSNKGLTSLSIETIRDDIPVFIASHNSWHRQSPFFLRDGATTRLGATPGCGRCHVLYCGKDRFRNAPATMRPATASGPSVSTPPRRAASGHVPAAGH